MVKSRKILIFMGVVFCCVYMAGCNSPPDSPPPSPAKKVVVSRAIAVPALKSSAVADSSAAVKAASVPKKVTPAPVLKYDPAGRVDPFIPLIQEKESSGGVAEEEKVQRILTPLEKLDLSQLKLVAVVIMKNKRLAMVEEASGKGYEVGIGTYMGKNSGQVSEIRQSSILVKEYIKDFKGKRQVHFQEIKLHKSGSGD